MTGKLNVIGLAVSDMAASLAFYRRLGLDIPAGMDAESHVGIPLSGEIQLMLDTDAEMESFDSGYRPVAGPGRVSVAFGLDTPADVDRLYGDLIAAGHAGHLAPFDAFWGQRYAVVRDPDGTNVDLYAPQP